MLVPHLLFIHSAGSASGLHRVIVLAMSIYAALQIGGISLINLIDERLGKSLVLCAGLRIAGSAMLLLSHSAAILTGSAALALGHAIFYKESRVTAALVPTADRFPFSQSTFAGLQLSTHLAFVIAPSLGAMVLALGSNRILLFACVVISNVIGVHLLSRLRSAEPVAGTAMSTDAQQADTIANPDRKWANAIRLFVVVLSYSVFIALSPIKTQQAGLGPATNAELSAVNSGIIMIILILPGRMLKWTNTHIVTDVVLVSVAVVLAGALVADWSWYIVSLSIWSVLAAVAVPHIEKRIFCDARYSTREIDALLLIDSFGSFAGPLLADVSQHFDYWL